MGVVLYILKSEGKGGICMKIEEKHKKRIEKIVSEMQCPKDFECYKSGLSKLCKVRDIGMDSFVECLGGKAENCKFSVSFGEGYLCKCPLRVYIAKKLKK